MVSGRPLNLIVGRLDELLIAGWVGGQYATSIMSLKFRGVKADGARRGGGAASALSRW